MFSGTALLVSADERERGHFAQILRSLDWAPVYAGSVPEALRLLATLDAEILLLTEGAAGVSLLSGLRVLCEVAPNLPVALVLPDDRLGPHGSLASAGLLRRSATAEEVRALLDASLEMRPTRRLAALPGVHHVPEERVRIEVRRVGDAAILAPEDRLDLAGYADLEERLDAVAQEGCVRIVLDLAAVTVMSSACFAVLMRFWADFQARGGRLAIARPSERAASAIEACGLDRIVPVFGSVDEALDAVRGGRFPTGGQDAVR